EEWRGACRFAIRAANHPGNSRRLMLGPTSTDPSHRQRALSGPQQGQLLGDRLPARDAFAIAREGQCTDALGDPDTRLFAMLFLDGKGADPQLTLGCHHPSRHRTADRIPATSEPKTTAVTAQNSSM